MIRLAVRELLTRRVATALAVLGVTTAVLGFVLLAATAQTTSAVLTGEVARTWRGPYQLLVRPAAARSELEERDGLIRPNYFSGLVGGITADQYATIRAIPGVEVAAPIALVGFVEWPMGWIVDLASVPAAVTPTVVRLQFSAVGESRLSRFPLGDQYVIVAPGGQLESTPTRVTLRIGSAVIECSTQIRCFAGGKLAPALLQGGGQPASVVPFALPVVVAGVDPAAEAALAGLDRCVTSGRYLQPTDVPAEITSVAGPQTAIPILVSQTTFIDETIEVTIARARDGASVLQGAAPSQLRDWESLEQRTTNSDELYRSLINGLGSGSFYNVSPLWSPGEVRYETKTEGQLRALTVPADLSVFSNPLVPSSTDAVPVEARDVWFRQLVTRPQVRRGELPNAWIRVGQYDPSCLPSFDRLAGGGGIDAYSLPRIDLSTGQVLGPTRSMAGYVNSPPLILTTLEGAQWFADTKRFSGATGDAFISAVRVKVAGASEAGAAAYGRLARTAAEIHERTGLAVDIVVGSSPKAMQVELPAGTYGRPQLVVSEGWSVKGVAYRFTRALQVQDLALFAVALVGALALVAQTAFVAVHRRRREFAVLRAMGWQRRHLATLVMLEVVGIGAIAAVLALVIGVPLSAVIAGELGGPALWVAPLALGVSVAGGTLPAIAVTRTTVTKTLAGSVAVRGKMPSACWRMGMNDVMRRRGREPLIGIAVIALAGTLLGAITAVEIGFRGQLDVTVLGGYIAGRVQPFHVAVALLTLAVGALAAGQIVTLGYLEQLPELAMLRAVGWRSTDVVAYVAGQAITLCGVGGLCAAALAMLLLLVLPATPREFLIAGASALLAPLVAGLLAVAGTLAHAYRISPAQLLRGE